MDITWNKVTRFLSLCGPVEEDPFPLSRSACEVQLKLLESSLPRLSAFDKGPIELSSLFSLIESRREFPRHFVRCFPRAFTLTAFDVPPLFLKAGLKQIAMGSFFDSGTCFSLFPFISFSSL